MNNITLIIPGSMRDNPKDVLIVLNLINEAYTFADTLMGKLQK